jgi:hypothetical protein
LPVPSEDHSRQEATRALTSVEGRWERDGNHQKKAMKTKSLNTKSGLRVRSSNHQETPTPDSSTSHSQPSTTPERPKLPPINFARRRANRELSTQSVLALLQKEAPTFFGVAEVVGKWVWVQFNDRQPREVTAVLAELGFHWNNKRQVWQHPCGALTEGTEADPRQKYPTYFPSDMKPA